LIFSDLTLRLKIGRINTVFLYVDGIIFINIWISIINNYKSVERNDAMIELDDNVNLSLLSLFCELPLFLYVTLE